MVEIFAFGFGCSEYNNNGTMWTFFSGEGGGVGEHKEYVCVIE